MHSRCVSPRDIATRGLCGFLTTLARHFTRPSLRLQALLHVPMTRSLAVLVLEAGWGAFSGLGTPKGLRKAFTTRGPRQVFDAEARRAQDVMRASWEWLAGQGLPVGDTPTVHVVPPESPWAHGRRGRLEQACMTSPGFVPRAPSASHDQPRHAASVTLATGQVLDWPLPAIIAVAGLTDAHLGALLVREGVGCHLQARGAFTRRELPPHFSSDLRTGAVVPATPLSVIPAVVRDCLCDLFAHQWLRGRANDEVCSALLADLESRDAGAAGRGEGGSVRRKAGVRGGAEGSERPTGSPDEDGDCAECLTRVETSGIRNAPLREAMRASAVFGMAGTLERVLLMGARKCRSWEAVHCLGAARKGREAGSP